MRRQPILFNEKRLRETMERKNIDLVILRTVENSIYVSEFFNNGGELGHRLSLPKILSTRCGEWSWGRLSQECLGARRPPNPGSPRRTAYSSPGSIAHCAYR
jgi:hypothetical protein